MAYKKLNIDLESPCTIAEKHKRPCIARIIYAIIFLAIIIIDFIYSTAMIDQEYRLVCYYAASPNVTDRVRLIDVPGELCTNLNIGYAGLKNASLLLSPELQNILENELPIFRTNNTRTKILLWIGNADMQANIEYANMISTHAKRKMFISSLKPILKKYVLDGIDLDWEFPSAYKKERQHFTQLLEEIRAEWRRERVSTHLLSIAAAAPESIALFAYDISRLNIYVDYVNLMTYDFHSYTRLTPFTGLNAPLYARQNERSLLATTNINYTVNWWLQQGLEPQRLVVGLPTYGHSFTLVNQFNNHIGAPAASIGKCGRLGFTTYSETCRCAEQHLHTTFVFDNETCSPYLSSGQEWISYENVKSIQCKTEYIKSLKLGGVMIFLLNADDTKNYCKTDNEKEKALRFPLTETVKNILF